MTTRVNVTEVTQEKEVSNIATTDNFVTDMLTNTKHVQSNKVLKTIKSFDFEFAAVRSIILTHVANNEKMSFAQKFDSIRLLRKSKKDSKLYFVLRSLAAFNYKAIKSTEKTTEKTVDKVVTTVKQINAIKKSFNQTSVLYACDLYNSLDVRERDNAALISSFVLEYERIAVKKAFEAIATAQNVCNAIVNEIEVFEKVANLTAAQKQILNDKREELVKANTQLMNKVNLHDYVKLSINRKAIK